MIKAGTVDKIIQRKFQELLKAKRSGRKYEFKKELVSELKKEAELLKEQSSDELSQVNKLLKELKN